jgi:hypothetical protein
MIDQGIDPREEKRERIAAAEAKREEAKAHRNAGTRRLASLPCRPGAALGRAHPD